MKIMAILIARRNERNFHSLEKQRASGELRALKSKTHAMYTPHPKKKSVHQKVRRQQKGK